MNYTTVVEPRPSEVPSRGLVEDHHRAGPSALSRPLLRSSGTAERNPRPLLRPKVRLRDLSAGFLHLAGQRSHWILSRDGTLLRMGERSRSGWRRLGCSAGSRQARPARQPAAPTLRTKHEEEVCCARPELQPAQDPLAGRDRLGAALVFSSSRCALLSTAACALCLPQARAAPPTQAFGQCRLSWAVGVLAGAAALAFSAKCRRSAAGIDLWPDRRPESKTQLVAGCGS